MSQESDHDASKSVLDVPSAADVRGRMAEREQEKLAEAARKQRQEDEHQKSVMESLRRPLAAPPEEIVRHLTPLVRAAAERGATEVVVYRFPNALCTDRGRAINNGEPGWEQTLTGQPRSAFEFWRDHLRDKGYKLSAEILEFPDGMPGDVGFILSWK
ncbi:MAG: hypothetical protein U1E53_02255 [Dongiaceae bacterium]